MLTLDADTAAGTLYTLTIGTKSVNFGGKAVDTTKPTVSKVESTDFNEMTIIFSEPVKLTGAVITAAMKYGAKTDLALSNIKYNGSTKIVFTTADQAAATLYGTSISGVSDLAGNVMGSDTTQTFVGQAKPTADEKIASVKAIDYNKVYVDFGTNVDPATIVAANFTIAEAYGSKTAATVSAAAPAAASDATDFNSGYTSSSNPTNATYAKHGAVLTLGTDLKDSTLYTVTVANVKTLYGKSMSTTEADYKVTFVGKAKPASDSLTYTVSVVSNTQIKLDFTNKLDKAAAETVANYAIAKAYGDKAALTVTAAAQDADDKSIVKLTVGSMSNELYKVTATNVKDIYGNTVKTSSDANIVSFAGKGIAAKISSFVSAIISSSDNTILNVVFNENVASDATDVSKYFIDNSIGYPNKAVIDSTDPKQVNMTIPKTVDGKIYKLTVKGLNNSDGVAMDSAGISTTFTGKGISATKAEVKYVIALDNQTLEIFFDRDVTDPTVKGQIWTGSTAVNNLIGNALKITNASNIGAGALTALDSVNEYAYQDPNNAMGLIVRVPTHEAFKTLISGQTVMTITPDSTKTVNTAAVQLAPNTSDPAAPALTNVMALDKRTIRVYFSDKVDTSGITLAAATTAGNNIKILSAETSGSVYNGTTEVVVSNFTKVNDTTYDLGLNADLDANCVTTSGGSTKISNSQVYVYVVSGGKEDGTGTGAFQDRTKIIELAVDNATSKVYVSRLMGVSSTAVTPDSITDINILSTDKRTLEVYFPEVMNTTAGASATKVNEATNYKLMTTSAGDTGASVVSVPKYVEYDGTTNKATLYFGNDLSNATDGANKLTSFYLAIGGSIQNATLTKSIKDEKSGLAAMNAVTVGLVRQFAVSTTDAGKPAIVSATVDDSRKKITVVFDRKVTFGAATSAFSAGLTADEYMTSTLTYADGATTNEQDKVTNAFKLTATRADGAAIAETLAYAGLNDKVASVVRKDDNKTIEINLTYALKAGTSGTLEILPTANLVASWTDVTNTTTASDVSKVNIGVAATSLFGDTTAPTVLGTSVLGNLGTGTAGTIENGDTITLDFSEAMMPTALVAASVNVVVSKDSPNVVKIYKGATSTAAADLIATITTSQVYNNDAANSMTFNGSNAGWNATYTQLVITLQGKANGTVQAAQLAGTSSIVMSGNVLMDTSGNAIGTAAVTSTSGRF